MGWATVLMPAPASEEGLPSLRQAFKREYLHVKVSIRSSLSGPKYRGWWQRVTEPIIWLSFPPSPKGRNPIKVFACSSQPLPTALVVVVVVVQHPKTAMSAKVSFGPGSGSGSMQEPGSPPKRNRGSFPHDDLHPGWQDR